MNLMPTNWRIREKVEKVKKGKERKKKNQWWNPNINSVNIVIMLSICLHSATVPKQKQTVPSNVLLQ